MSPAASRLGLSVRWLVGVSVEANSRRRSRLEIQLHGAGS